MTARSSNAPSMGRIQKRKTNLSKSSLSACNARPVHTEGPGPDSCTATKSGRFNGAILSLDDTTLAVIGWCVLST